ncbi:MAG: metallophosphoesterase family protein [Treponema sp.]|nr:metallophosphoesterase family protein [Treponema sp.]
MKFLVLSDLHGNGNVLEKLDEHFKEADAVLFAGDFAQFGKTETSLPMLELLCKKHDTIFAVLGNCDEPSFAKELDRLGVNVERSLVFFEGLYIAGSGGGSKFTGTTPNEKSEEELMSDFALVQNTSEGADSNGKWRNLILISHNPPKDTNCDAVNATLHAGSVLFRGFIEKISPLVVVTGHIHEGCAIDKIGDTVVINPGALLDGKYATLELEKLDGTWNVKNAELHTVGV